MALTLLAGSLAFPPNFSDGIPIWLALGGELALGVVLYILAEEKLFLPAERWREEMSASHDGIPREAGILTPLAASVAEKYETAMSGLEKSALGQEARLRHMEMLRRDLEETKAHLEAKIRDLHSIYEVTTAIAGTLDTEELFRIIPEKVMQTLGLNDFLVFLYSPEKRRLVCRASAGALNGLPEDFGIASGEGVVGRVFSTGEPVYLPDVRVYPEFQYYGGARTDVRSFLSVPLMSRGKAIGVLNVHHRETNAFDAESLATMRVLATHMAIAIENADLFQFVKTLAEKDSLTLLYNHGAFHEKLQIELERADRYGRSLSVIMMDLDSFKDVNDRYGHVLGDRILVMTAGVLCAHLRKSDIPARYGGDEFVVILPETDFGAASTIASRIAAGISEVRLETGKGGEISFTASIGYATCSPGSSGRDRILSIADRLMYESKRRGRGGVLGEQI